MNIIKKRIVLLITLPIFLMLAAGVISYCFVVPVYQTSTTLLVNRPYDNQNDRSLQYNDILLAKELVNTYSQIAKSHLVANEVITIEKLKITPREFSKKVDVRPINTTQLIEITVKDTDPNLAACLANTLASVFIVRVESIMQVDNIDVVDPAFIPQTPSKPNIPLNIIIAGIVGLFLSLGITFLREYVDQQNKTNNKNK